MVSAFPWLGFSLLPISSIQAPARRSGPFLPLLCYNPLPTFWSFFARADVGTAFPSWANWSWSSKPCCETGTQTLQRYQVPFLEDGKGRVTSPELGVFGCPQLQTHSKSYRSFRERVLAKPPHQVPTHVSKCHQWELRLHHPAHNAPLKTFQQLN